MMEAETKRKVFFALLGCLLLVTPCAEAQEAGPLEYQVKAAFLYNFAKFVEWPDDTDTLNICVLDEDYFAGDYDNIEGKIAAGKVVSVRRIQALRDLQKCRMVFVAASENSRLDSILAAAHGLNVLTVGDVAGYAERGVVINFYREQNKIRFEINRDAADRLGLKISSKLFGLARIVHDPPKRKGD